METLSIAGVDGTIKKRFRHNDVNNRAWMKNGTIRRVKNIGGYLRNKAGKYYTVVIIINSSKAKYRGAKLQNEIMKWLAKTTAKPSVRPASKKHLTQKTTQKKNRSENLFSNVKTTSPSKVIQTAEESGVKYYVQAGSFAAMPNKKYLSDITALGLRYTVRHSDRYKVLIGGYLDETSARNALKKVRQYINSGAFLIKL